MNRVITRDGGSTAIQLHMPEKKSEKQFKFYSVYEPMMCAVVHLREVERRARLMINWQRNLVLTLCVYSLRYKYESSM